MSRGQSYQEAKEAIQIGGTPSPKLLRHELVGTVKEQRGGVSVRTQLAVWLVRIWNQRSRQGPDHEGICGT